MEWASKEKSSKKHVIEVQTLLRSHALVDSRSRSAFVTWRSRIVPPQLKTRQGTELLIQSEIDSVVNDWYRALTETINTHVRKEFVGLWF